MFVDCCYRLHEEIVDFYNYMAPLQEEVYMRTEIVNRLRQVATSLWPNAEVGAADDDDYYYCRW